MPAAEIGTNSQRARGLASWIMRATSSLPEPAGPEIMTRELAGATLAMVERRSCAAAELPTSPSGTTACERSRLFSRRRLVISSARCTTMISRSVLNGFSMKSKAPFLMAETAVSMVPWPEIMIAGMSGSSSWITLSSSSPSRPPPCIQMSSTHKDGLRALIARRAAFESAAVRTA